MPAARLLPSGNGNLLQLSRQAPSDWVWARRWRRSNSTALLLHRRYQDKPAASRQLIGVSQAPGVSQPRPSVSPVPAACLRRSVGRLAPLQRPNSRPGPAQELFSYHLTFVVTIVPAELAPAEKSMRRKSCRWSSRGRIPAYVDNAAACRGLVRITTISASAMKAAAT